MRAYQPDLSLSVPDRLRAFHDELLKDGAMPLSILEVKMDRWIEARRRKPS